MGPLVIVIRKPISLEISKLNYLASIRIFLHKHMLIIQHILEFHGIQHQACSEQRLDALLITHDHKELTVGAADPLEVFIFTLEALFAEQCDNLHHFNLRNFFSCQIQSLFFSYSCVKLVTV